MTIIQISITAINLPHQPTLSNASPEIPTGKPGAAFEHSSLTIIQISITAINLPHQPTLPNASPDWLTGRGIRTFILDHHSNLNYRNQPSTPTNTAECLARLAYRARHSLPGTHAGRGTFALAGTQVPGFVQFDFSGNPVRGKDAGFSIPLGLLECRARLAEI